MCGVCRTPLWRNKGGAEETFAGDDTDRQKLQLKGNARLYSWFVDALSPVYPVGRFLFPRWVKMVDWSGPVVNIGAGNSNLDPRLFNVDFLPYPNVHLCADAQALPIPDESVSGVVSIAMLEHVPDPELAMAEIMRIMKPGAHALIFVPFIQGFHASPHDYTRYTHRGLRRLLAPCEELEFRMAGPTSAVVWILSAWLSLVLSVGSSRLQRFLALGFSVLFSPLKWLDALLQHAPGAESIASGFAFIVRKPDVATRNDLLSQ